MKRINKFISMFIFISFILIAFLSFSFLVDEVPSEMLQNAYGYTNLEGFDFEKELLEIPHTSFLYYKEGLYTAEDFKNGDIARKPIELSNQIKRFDPGDYGTYRLVLKLPSNGTVYGYSSYSAMYSQRLFINGKSYAPFGTPSTSAKSTTPQMGYYTVYFTPEKEETEIIVQFANFYHADFGGIVHSYLGSEELIQRRDVLTKQRIHLVLGINATVFIFFFGMFLFFRRRSAFLWFSIISLTMGLRASLIQEKVLLFLLPNMPWKVSIGLEYISLIILMCSFLLYINAVFRGALHKLMIRGFIVLCVIFTSMVLLLPTVIYTGYILEIQICGALFGVYVVIALMRNLIRNKENRHAEHMLMLVGGVIFIVLSILDIHIHRSGGMDLFLGLTEIGMLVLVFTNMIALILQFSRTETELDEVRQKEREMQKSNRLMDQMNHMKSDFMANISHEMRTPLTVIANYAGLTAIQLRHGVSDQHTFEHLDTIKREAIRLGNMVEQLKEVSVEKERQLTLVEVSVKEILRQAADFCEPICQKNNNQMMIDESMGDIKVLINRDSIFQVLINLIINGNRHTKEGIIWLSSKLDYPQKKGELIKFTVSDNGDGIDESILNEVFKRGFSGDGRTGLGLAISQEIIEEHGGEIWIENNGGSGVCISFTLPYRKGDGDLEECIDLNH